MQASRITFLLLWATVVAACSQTGSTGPTPLARDGDSLAQVSGQGPGPSPLAAVMQFGQVNVGSGFPPGSQHDQSAHAVDNIVPGTVVIGVGGTVTFNVPAGVHQIRIYKPGTEPEDIDTGVLTSLSAFAGCGAPLPPTLTGAPLVIADTTNLEAAIPVPCLTPTQKSHTFNAPGRYLVICAFLPHFELSMYAWVEVRESAR